jgi:hypothetical protein
MACLRQLSPAAGYLCTSQQQLLYYQRAIIWCNTGPLTIPFLPPCCRSRYDFGPWPLLSFVDALPAGVSQVLQSTEALFVNGFVFDELPAEAVLAAATAQAAGAAVFFDPGGWCVAGSARSAAAAATLHMLLQECWLAGQ